jgi:hypothetical protein
MPLTVLIWQCYNINHWSLFAILSFPKLLNVFRKLRFFFRVNTFYNNTNKWKIFILGPISDSAVGRATLRAGQLRGRSSSPITVKNFPFSTSSRPALGPIQPPIKWVLGALSPGVKRQRRETDHSLPTSAEVKEMWIYTTIPPYPIPHGVVLN